MVFQRKSEWEQISSDLQDFSQYSIWFKKMVLIIPMISKSSNFFKAFGDHPNCTM